MFESPQNERELSRDSAGHASQILATDQQIPSVEEGFVEPELEPETVPQLQNIHIAPIFAQGYKSTLRGDSAREGIRAD
jgi:hypothetical protein